MSRLFRLALKVSTVSLMLTQVVTRMTSAVDVVHVKSARYGAGSSWIDVTTRMRQECDGKQSCSGVLKEGMFQDIARNRVKMLEVSYDCGSTSSQTAQTYEVLIWRFSCPPVQQPTVRVNVSIDEEGSNKSGDRSLKLPSGYRYCFERKYDWSKVGNSDSSSKPTYGPDGRQDGISIHWEAKTKGAFAGDGSVHHLWSIFGALPGSDCPGQ